MNLVRQNRGSCPTVVLAALTSAGAVAQITGLIGSLELLEQSGQMMAAALGRHLDVRA